MFRILYSLTRAIPGVANDTIIRNFSQLPSTTRIPVGRFPSTHFSKVVEPTAKSCCMKLPWNPQFQQVRTNVRIYYRPSAWRRVHKHSFEKRISTPAGISTLWRRLLKGRRTLTVFDRFFNPVMINKVKRPVNFNEKVTNPTQVFGKRLKSRSLKYTNINRRRNKISL